MPQDYLKVSHFLKWHGLLVALLSFKKSIYTLLLFVVFSANLNAVSLSTVGVFSGFGTPFDIRKILTNKTTHKFSNKNILAGISGQYVLAEITQFVHVLGEIQLIQHFGTQKCQEVTLAPLIRVANIFNTKILPIHFSIGDGVSGLIGEPKLEQSKQPARRVLNYLLLEFAMPIFNANEVFIRWHHRCHINTAIAPSGTGANFLVLGFRMKF